VTQPTYPWRPLGRLLVEAGLIGSPELEDALAEQQRNGRRLGEILVARGAISGPELTQVLAKQSGIEVTLAPGAEVRPTDLGDGNDAGPVSSLRVDRSVQTDARAKPVRPDDGTASGASKPWRPLGSLLVERGALSEAQLADALHEQLTSDRRLGEILVERGFVTTFDLVAAVIDQHGLERTTEPGDFLSASLAARAREVYEVEGEDGPGGTAVLFRAGGFLEATDFAFELLEAEQRSWLRIVRVRKGEREEVWAYDEDRADEAAAASDLVQVYGFNPARWTGPPT
jgi:hypothetical protein